MGALRKAPRLSRPALLLSGVLAAATLARGQAGTPPGAIHPSFQVAPGQMEVAPQAAGPQHVIYLQPGQAAPAGAVYVQQPPFVPPSPPLVYAPSGQQQQQQQQAPPAGAVYVQHPQPPAPPLVYASPGQQQQQQAVSLNPFPVGPPPPSEPSNVEYQHNAEDQLGMQESNISPADTVPPGVYNPHAGGQNCRDVPQGWTDKNGGGCQHYADRNYCTAHGAYGPGWTMNFGSAADHSSGGYSAFQACCSCGGGSQPAPMFSPQGITGPCTVDRVGCILSPNYPHKYSNSQKCVIEVNRNFPRPLIAPMFHTETKYDYILIDGVKYSGTQGPDFITPMGDTIVWSSDYSASASGWRICEGDRNAVSFDDRLGWKLQSGECGMDEEGCATSPLWPQAYAPNQRCIITVAPANRKLLDVISFETESPFDNLTVNGRGYNGREGPHGVVPYGPGAIVWSSDFSREKAGWKICLTDSLSQVVQPMAILNGPELSEVDPSYGTPWGWGSSMLAFGLCLCCSAFVGLGGATRVFQAIRGDGMAQYGRMY